MDILFMLHSGNVILRLVMKNFSVSIKYYRQCSNHGACTKMMEQQQQYFHKFFSIANECSIQKLGRRVAAPFELHRGQGPLSGICMHSVLVSSPSHEESMNQIKII